MAHVNNFERDIERREMRDEIYRRDAVEVYKYDGTTQDLLDNRNDISDFIRHHLEAQVPRPVSYTHLTLPTKRIV